MQVASTALDGTRSDLERTGTDPSNGGHGTGSDALGVRVPAEGSRPHKW
jgi:hypothetical protein